MQKERKKGGRQLEYAERKEDGSWSMQKGRGKAAGLCIKEGGMQLTYAERKEERGMAA